ncbi:MAG: glycoside hydrolase family 127 protein [Rikenellaceae bacterium]|jgi:hypothetical protein|nr:glycoside hydrolase family 127 protein [Rikenellaceae bacterium]
MKRFLLFALLPLTCCRAERFETVDRPNVSARNSHYVGNSAPLQPLYFIELPPGAVRPEGWVGRQLELQADGLNGHLGEISSWLQREDNAWLGKGGRWGWEEVPYWLRGYFASACIRGDSAMLAESRFWIEAMLESGQPDGYFGPVNEDDKGRRDLWPNMLVCWIMQDYYEYTGDGRVIPFLLNYCKWLAAWPDEKFLERYWDNSRGGDMLRTIAWLYNRTGDRSLLELAQKAHRNTADWMRSTELPNWHVVNIAQGFREPAQWWAISGEHKGLEASYNVFSLVRRAFGQVPGGMYGADENARIGFFDPRQGTETCAFVEQMISDNIMLQLTGDPLWAENCEDVAFNSYPAALMPDHRALRYLTCPNHAVSDAKNHHPGVDNRGPFLAMNPFSSRCCQHNHGIGWPYYIRRLIMATPDNGAAAAVYSSCSAQLKVGDGQQITISESGNYPFEERVAFTIGTERPVAFPLYLRIPSWCASAGVSINGRRAAGQCVPGRYVKIAREWHDGDRVELALPMRLSRRTWQANKNSVSVDYGPLTLSLRIKEEYRQVDSRSSAIVDSQWQQGADASKWPSYEIYAASPWNYALADDSPISIRRRPWPEDDNPFTLGSVPLEFSARGRLVPSWQIDEYGLTGVLPNEWDERSEHLDEITLVPMGAARLRIAAFPTTKR